MQRKGKASKAAGEEMTGIKQVEVKTVVIVRMQDGIKQVLHEDDQIKGFPSRAAALQWMMALGWTESMISGVGIEEVEDD